MGAIAVVLGPEGRGVFYPAHGPAPGRMLLAVGDALRARAVRRQVEHAAAFDIDTGEAAGPLRTGRATEVDIDRQTAAMRADRRYVSMHTHHTSAAVSDLDVDVLLRNAPIRTAV